jgi:hypothetical protein
MIPFPVSISMRRSPGIADSCTGARMNEPRHVEPSTDPIILGLPPPALERKPSNRSSESGPMASRRKESLPALQATSSRGKPNMDCSGISARAPLPIGRMRTERLNAKLCACPEAVFRLSVPDQSPGPTAVGGSHTGTTAVLRSAPCVKAPSQTRRNRAQNASARNAGLGEHPFMLRRNQRPSALEKRPYTSSGLPCPSMVRRRPAFSYQPIRGSVCIL